MEQQSLGIIKNDKWLKPFEPAIRGRHDHYLAKRAELLGNKFATLSDFATGHLWYGLHRTADGWVFRILKVFVFIFVNDNNFFM